MPLAAAVPSRGRRPLVIYLDYCARLSDAEHALARLLPNLQAAVEVHVSLAENGLLIRRLCETGVPVSTEGWRDAPPAFLGRHMRDRIADDFLTARRYSRSMPAR